MFSLEEIKKVIENPHESLSVELKDWLNPDNPIDQAKIIKAILAMRNNDGGLLIIGINKNGQYNFEQAPNNVEEIFNIDKMQGLVTKYASESFEIGIHYPEKEHKKFVAIVVPSRIKTPVVVKRPLVDNSKNIIQKDCVFVRSLDSNNTPSTTNITCNDWPKLIERCFDNREADIGNFLRKHLSNISNLREISNFFSKENEDKKQTIEEETYNFLVDSLTRYNEIVAERKIQIPPHGAMEVAAIIKGNLKNFTTNRDFLNLVLSNNPDYTGWPIWVDSRNFSDTTARPYVFKGYWESFIAHLGSGFNDDVDFWRISPKGRLYLRRALQDDFGGSKTEHTYLKTVDFGLVVLRVAEAIAVAIAFAKAMECNEEASIFFAFRWTKLKNRILSSWANPARHLSYDRKSIQDEVASYIEVPINAPKSALYTYTHEVNKSIFELFDGFELSEEVSKDLVTRLLERNL